MNSIITPIKTYIAIWASLMLLLGTTWGIAQFDLGAFNVLAALTIAVAKMLLVILFRGRFAARPRIPPVPTFHRSNLPSFQSVLRSGTKRQQPEIPA